MSVSSSLLHDGLSRAAARHGSRPGLLAGDRTWSFAELEGLAGAAAAHLANRGVRPGDRVAVMLSNRVDFVVAVHGISRAGAAAVLLSPAWKALEVRHALELTAPTHAFADGDAVVLLASTLGDEAVTDVDAPPLLDRREVGAREPGPAAWMAVSLTRWLVSVR